MSMLPRDMERKVSRPEGYVQIEGYPSLIVSLKKEIKNYILIGKDLYETQDQIKDFLVHKYGEDWYLKSRDAINYIIENEYSTYFYNREGVIMLHSPNVEVKQKRKKELLSWYSELYPYAIGLLILANAACVYCLSTGNLQFNGWLAFILWAVLIIIGLTSFACKKKLENIENL